MMNRAVELMNERGRAVYTAGCMMAFFLLFFAGIVLAATATNKMSAVAIDMSSGAPVLSVTTENPVGYRYTVYDSIDPIRVVVDFPGMDVEGVDTPDASEVPGIKEVKVSAFDLTSGKLGRIEVILDQSLPYDVALNDTTFTMSFTDGGSDTVVADSAAETDVVAEAGAVEPVTDVAVQDDGFNDASLFADQSGDATPVVSAAPAAIVTGVDVADSSITIEADGRVEVLKYFKLGAPARLVVDVYGLKAGFKSRKYNLDNGFKQLRVGTYSDKIRFVLDAMGSLPEYSVVSTDSGVRVSWGDLAGEEVDVVPAPVVSGVPVNIEAIDFSMDEGQSQVKVTLSGAAAIIEPTVKDDIVGFGIKNASISRALRRAIDASSFPSSIRLVTPYTVLVGKKQDVRFAVELKGPSDYSIATDGNVVTLTVANGPFAEPEAPAGAQVAVSLPDGVAPVPVDASEQAEVAVVDTDVVDMISTEVVVEESGSTMPSAAVNEGDVSSSGQQTRKISATAENIYSGQRISLVFDNANIRNILQLIAEVSNLNILAGEGVDGTITLRLIDVPWDQALDLILETNDLGMIRDGNVARILPKESIRAMDEAKFTADRTKEKLENLEKAVITVSYTDLKNVSGPAKEFLTERGTITEDSRNKKLIVKDIPKVIQEIQDLVAVLDTPEKQVLIEARIVEVSTNAALDLGVNWDVFYSQDASFDPLLQNTGGEVGLGGNFVIPAFAAGTGQTAGAGAAFSWGKVGVNTTILDLRLSALESAGEGQIVSNPRVMTLNGEKAKISQGTSIPYQTSTNDELKTEFVEADLSLEVTPIINPDNSVILKIKATNSSPGQETLAGPLIDTKEAETMMLVNDGDTMVIGGIYVEQENSVETGVPLLMHVPLLGHLFKSTAINKTRNELMIFVTPRIVE